MDEQQQPVQITQEQYLAFMGQITQAVYRDLQIAQQLARKAFGPDVTPETVLGVYDRILDRLPTGEPADEGADEG